MPADLWDKWVKGKLFEFRKRGCDVSNDSTVCQVVDNCTHIGLHHLITVTTPETMRPMQWKNWNPVFCAVSCDMAVLDFLMTGHYNEYDDFTKPPERILFPFRYLVDKEIRESFVKSTSKLCTSK